MEFTCEHCKARLNVPDEKIPKDQLVKVSCPKCKNKITLDTHKAARRESFPTESTGPTETGRGPFDFAESKRAVEPVEESYGYDDYSEDQALDFFEEGVRLALVMACDTDQSEMIKVALEELGYKYVSSPNIRDAIGKMRFHHFDLVFLCDGFDGQQLEHSTVLDYLNHISMSLRRRIFVALMSDKFRSMDNMMGYAMSANLVINPKDGERLSAILKKAISDNEKFYKVFMDTLLEIGKA